MSHAARIAAAGHIAWNSLFMSNAMTLACMTFGTRKSATIQAREEGTPRRVARQQRRSRTATIASANGTPRLVR